jgi:uncharacterized membrane protein YqjE
MEGFESQKLTLPPVKPRPLVADTPKDSSMSNPTERPLFADVRTELGSLGAELREMVAARWQLARLEIEADVRSAKRLIIAWLVAVVMLLTALPVAAVGLAEALDGWQGISRVGWLLIFAAALVVLAIAGVCFAWRRFRRNFLGLRETLEELREDAVWFKEKTAATTPEQADNGA